MTLVGPRSGVEKLGSEEISNDSVMGLLVSSFQRKVAHAPSMETPTEAVRGMACTRKVGC